LTIIKPVSGVFRNSKAEKLARETMILFGLSDYCRMSQVCPGVTGGAGGEYHRAHSCSTTKIKRTTIPHIALPISLDATLWGRRESVLSIHVNPDVL
jgi:hypothetical protein